MTGAEAPRPTGTEARRPASVAASRSAMSLPLHPQSIVKNAHPTSDDDEIGGGRGGGEVNPDSRWGRGMLAVTGCG
uniref:Uncharacterized protein n=1 Tax=Oryza sativa subsp. japonica TaxID=39947 RepID=Q84YQ7_ORYSJ|nr:hypothetical protein [Oryza sativa Japonica Group]